MTTYTVGLVMQAASFGAPTSSGSPKRLMLPARKPQLGTATGSSGYYEGNFKLDVLTTAHGLAYPARVYVFPEDAPTYCVASGYSGVAGSITFTGLRTGKYIVLALDPTNTWDVIGHVLQDAVPM
jgi:hypothetical protein